ncbi:MAG: sigma-70 family RNA polymerase sigma factor [bacterium]|nr:sigma-70 family RNA polymerase sigma factor [bacterium]
MVSLQWYGGSGLLFLSNVGGGAVEDGSVAGSARRNERVRLEFAHRDVAMADRLRAAAQRKPIALEIEHVTVHTTTRYAGGIGRATLDPANPLQVRRVLRSNRAFDLAHPPSYARMRRMMFMCPPLFVGSGDYLLSYLARGKRHHRSSSDRYLACLAQVAPELASDLYLRLRIREDGVRELLRQSERSNASDREVLFGQLRRTDRPLSFERRTVLVDAQDMVTGRHTTYDTERLYDAHELHCVLEQALSTLSSRRGEYIVRERFYRGRTLEEVGQDLELTKERIRVLESKALRKLRHLAHSLHLKVFVE